MRLGAGSDPDGKFTSAYQLITYIPPFHREIKRQPAIAL
jgi:hypothetical protein